MQKVFSVLLIIFSSSVCTLAQNYQRVMVDFSPIATGVMDRTDHPGTVMMTLADGTTKKVVLHGTGEPLQTIGVQADNDYVYLATGNAWLDKVYISKISFDGEFESTVSMPHFDNGVTNTRTGFAIDTSETYYIQRWKRDADAVAGKSYLVGRYTDEGTVMWERSRKDKFCKGCKSLIPISMRQSERGVSMLFDFDGVAGQLDYNIPSTVGGSSKKIVGRLGPNKNPTRLVETKGKSFSFTSSYSIPKDVEFKFGQTLFNLSGWPIYIGKRRKSSELVVVNSMMNTTSSLNSIYPDNGSGPLLSAIDEKGQLILSFSTVEKKVKKGEKKKKRLWTRVVEVYDEQYNLVSTKKYDLDTELKFGEKFLMPLKPAYAHDGKCVFIDKLSEDFIIASYDMSNVIQRLPVQTGDGSKIRILSGESNNPTSSLAPVVIQPTTNRYVILH